MTGAFVAALVALTQIAGDSLALKAAPPRFLLATTDSTAPSVEIDPSGLPAYGKRIALSLGGVSRREALRRIAVQSGLQFVYANDLIAAEDTVQLNATDMLVVVALTEVLRGASIDVAVSYNGNAVLMRRRTPSTLAVPSDTIRGRVTGDSGQLVDGALVRATMAPNRELFEARSGVQGTYELVVPNGTGDYLVHISAPSRPAWKPVRMRVTRTSATQHLFVVDALLKPAPVQALPQVTVSAERSKPQRSEPTLGSPNVGGSEVDVGGVFAALGPEVSGNVNAAALTVPGVIASSGGFSVLGLSGSQNRVTLNGMTFGGAGVPRDARTYTTITTSTYDPARGWFGGAEARLSLQAGTFLHNIHSSLTLDHPAAQAGDRVATKLGQKYQNVITGIGGDGLLFNDRLSYSFGAQASQRQSDLSTVADGDAVLLQRAGMSADTAVRFLQTLGTLGVPVWRRGQATSPLQQSASIVARLNTPPYDMKTRKPARTSVGLVIAASVDGTDGPTSVLTTPASTAGTHGGSGSLQLLYSTYLTPFVLQDLTVAANMNERRQRSGLSVPRGSVSTASDFANGSRSLATLGFGGGSGDVQNRDATWEVASETRFYPSGKPSHQVKLNADLRLDEFTRAANFNPLGTYSYNSLADLAAGRPARFTRTLVSPDAQARALNAFVSLGDQWRAGATVRLQYGVRLEGNRFLDLPELNPALASAFGVQNDRGPNRLHASPRLGFTWYFASHPTYGGLMMNGWGIYPSPPVGVLRGGIGEFRSLLPASVLADASASTGLPGSLQQVACVGDAVPVPDWASWVNGSAGLPRSCASGAGSALQDAAPSVALVSRNYDAPRSWRANLSWTSSAGPVTLFAEGVYSLNLNQTSSVDLNFSGRPQFTLADEGRPMFVPASGIATTGALVTGGARLRSEYGAVRQLVSDLRSESAQATFSANAYDLNLFGARQTISLAYTLRSVRSQERGFDGTTFGDPSASTWGRSPLDVRHGIVLQAGYGGKWGNITLAGVFASGRPFTPRVGADINGDGLLNDRAFVFDPAHATDPVLVASMRDLLANASAGVRRCLERQVGQVASRNGCEGPWTADLNARIALNTWTLGERWRRWTIALYIANPLGGLDAALHGSNLRGWGSTAYPDPTLYRVTGFDAAARRYQYVVNPRFADTRPSASTLRTPFRVTLDIQRSISPSVSRQQLDRMLRPGRGGRQGNRLTSKELVARYRRSVLDPYTTVIEEADSLLLQPSQITALQTAQAAYVARVDSIWSELADQLALLPDTYDAKKALALQEATIDRVWDVGRLDTKATFPAILDVMQRKLLPYPASMYFNAKAPIKGIRYFRP